MLFLIMLFANSSDHCILLLLTTYYPYIHNPHFFSKQGISLEAIARSIAGSATSMGVVIVGGTIDAAAAGAAPKKSSPPPPAVPSKAAAGGGKPAPVAAGTAGKKDEKNAAKPK